MLDSRVLPQESTSAHLLVVDDEPNIRSPLVRALNLLGYFTKGAGSGYEALELLECNSYDLMVLDMHMPGLDGIDVMHQARQLHPELLIIVLTGHATLENAIAAVKSEAADYLCKPVSIDEIVDTVTQALQKQTKWQHQQRLIHMASEILESLQENETSPITHTDGPSDRFISLRPLTLDRQNRLVGLGENPTQTIQLTEGEVTVLANLMSHPNQVISCRQLARLSWNQDLSESEAESIIRPYIFRLRRKLEINPEEPQIICTIRKLGYRFTPAKTD